MDLNDIYQMLSSVEEKGGEAKTFLKNYLTEKYRKYSEDEKKLADAEKVLATLAEALGVTIEELPTTVKGLQSKETEVKNLNELITSKEKEITDLKSEVGGLQRRERLADFAAVVGADKEVLNELLPQEVEFSIAEVTDNGKVKKTGVIVQGKDSVPFADFVAASDKLKKFTSSIFTQANNPPGYAPKLPTGKSSDSPKAVGIADKLAETQKKKAAALRDRLQ